MKRLFLVLALLAVNTAYAGSPDVYEKAVNLPLDTAYQQVSKSLEAHGFKIVHEVNIGENLSKLADKLGSNYNKSQLQGIKSIIFCNGKYANQISNLDPAMLALCPLHVTLIHKGDITTVLFVRPGQVAKDSPAAKPALELEQAVVKTIETGLNAK